MAQELLSTERAYVDKLNIIVEVSLHTLKKEKKEKKKRNETKERGFIRVLTFCSKLFERPFKESNVLTHEQMVHVS